MAHMATSALDGPYTDLRDLLPKLAINIGWLKLIGDAQIEQRRRQTVPRETSVSPAGQAHAARKASARTTARSKRRGYYGLARAIAVAK